MEKEKKLTKSEHLEMELGQEQVQNAKLLVEVGILRKNELLMKMKIHHLESEKQVKTRDDLINANRRKLTTIEYEHKVFVENIKIKYKIKNGFGVNPDTGVITED
jgi:hypothetical protein